jgi:hypothetical protein
MMTGLRRWLRIPDHFQPGVGSPEHRGVTQPAPSFRGGDVTHEAAPVDGRTPARYIGTSECFSSSELCGRRLNRYDPGIRQCRREGLAVMRKQPWDNRARRPLPPWWGLGSNPPPTPAGGPPGQTPGTEYTDPPDALRRAPQWLKPAGSLNIHV